MESFSKRISDMTPADAYKELQSVSYDLKLYKEEHDAKAREFVREIIDAGCVDLVLEKLVYHVIVDRFAQQGIVSMRECSLQAIHKLATSGKVTKERMRAIAELSKVKEHTGMED